jgi:ABC-type transport system involved in multi-copper enzyme maturation permease subunit
MSAPAIAVPGVTQSRVIVSEWIKFRSLRSTWISYGAVLLVTIGLGIVFSAVRGHDFAAHHAQFIDFDATQISLRGFYLAQLAAGVLGVLTITGEYSTGMIRASLSAVPRRTPVLVGKIVVFTVATFVICTLAALVAFLGGQAALSHYGYGVSLSSPGATRAVIGAGLFLAVVGLLALGCGFALRNTGGAIATLFGLILVLPLLAQALPTSWQDHITKYLPLPAGTAILATVRESDSLGPWAGLGVFALYAVAALAIGVVVLRRRDA